MLHSRFSGRLTGSASGSSAINSRSWAVTARRSRLSPTTNAAATQHGNAASARNYNKTSGAVYTAAIKQSSIFNWAKLCTGKLNEAPATTKETHKIFDEVFITVRAGDGGNGEIVQKGSGKEVSNHKYRHGANQPKKIWLPASEPAEGADGGDVLLVCDPSVDTLTHLHARSAYSAPKGSNANPAAGSMGPKNNAHLLKAETPALAISVPPGTVVKRKGTGQFIGELLSPGDRLLVARGGRGGRGVQAPSRQKRLRDHSRTMRKSRTGDTEVVEVLDVNWKEDSQGLPGQALSLHLLLRVVADIGIVGFPNAGKSSLLAALTRAKPEIASYPFTTLMPNLGVLFAGSQGPRPILADLPGLIDGAHTGRGLGRMFLRHLRRTRAILQVVDGAAADPATDYWAVREELRMYNPQYCARPHVVVLNKMDLMTRPAASDEVKQAIVANAIRFQAEYNGKLGSSRDDGVAWEGDQPSLPVAVLCVSALHSLGLGDLNTAIRRALAGERGEAAELLAESTAASPPVCLENHTAVGWVGAGQAAEGLTCTPAEGEGGLSALAGNICSQMHVANVLRAHHAEDWDDVNEMEAMDEVEEMDELDEEGQLEEADLKLLQLSEAELLALELD